MLNWGQEIDDDDEEASEEDDEGDFSFTSLSEGDESLVEALANFLREDQELMAEVEKEGS